MWSHSPTKEYDAVPEFEVESLDSSSDKWLDNNQSPWTRWPRQPFGGTYMAILMASLCLVLAFGAGWCIGRYHPADLDRICSRHTSNYSPILDEVDIRYSEWQFNGSFTQEDVYRQDPSREVDQAWEALGISNRVLIISEEEGRKSGLSPENHVQVNSKYGGGYPVMTEGLHQLHCLNLLRKSLWYSFDYYNATHFGEFSLSNVGQPFHWHVTHCLDFLRQRLMCTVDTGVFGAVWYNESDPTPFVDFNTKHVCKNFNDVRRWATTRQSPEELPDDFWEEPDPRKVLIRPDIP